ncbi:MAG TPA: hypothetical protein VK952_07695 [Methylotenera sp.]|nr:hypothetical protein [Methylotenera sp.]
MHKNYTLKQAVKTAIAILTMSAQTNALALGLGNVEVLSHLGQPLRASIKVQGASELKNVDCFSVVNDGTTENQLDGANFKLSKVVDDVAILTVTTNQVLNEPIMNLSIATECEANMRRDYVLLLDPPLTAEIGNNVDAGAFTELADDNTSAAVTTPAVRSKAAQTVKVSKGKKSIKSASTTKKDIVLTAGYTDIKSVETAQVEPKNTVAKESKPRLSISSGETFAMPSNNPQLRMDKQLQFTPENAPVSLQNALAGNIDINDEVTVMNNRMAHLKKQIDDLAQTNQTLKYENQAQLQQLEEANSAKKSLDWLGYLIGGALLLTSASIANKWRVRRQERLFEDARFALTSEHLRPIDGLNVDESFFDFDKKQALSNDPENATNAFVGENDSLFTSSTAEIQTQFSVQEFDDEQNILDHADVFLSHGRTTLAIQLLQNHLIDHPKKSVTEWLFLLDLLAKENMPAVYEQTALECKEHFNIRIAAFTNDEGSAKQHLEDFPRVIAGLEDVWGLPAAQVYLDDLIYNSRLENRVGFEKSVLEELLLLKSIAQEISNGAQVIQLDDKKMAIKAQKEAKLAADKEERIRKANELIEKKSVESQALVEQESPEALFEFTLAEYN